MKKRLITSALPYVNNIPHLGNLIQVLSADVFARFCRQYGYETLYVCGTDEYGTATETKAIEEGVSPRELCDRYYEIHRDIYQWFHVDFDHFGRTSRPVQTEIVQDIFKKIDRAGYIAERTIEQLYCPKDERFLADRYVNGTCPYCGCDQARGDQCETCGTLLDTVELVNPACGICGSTPVLRKTSHLYLNLPALLPKIKKWMDTASKDGFWARNALKMTEAWIRDGLKERAITRDLKWGIPVPREGYTDKVFYVWFDAPIGYVSITADLTDKWQEWWRSPGNTELFQFMGKDNIPFHTVIFPASQIATGETWTKLHHMSSSEYLNYEDGKFSKSKNLGVFGSDCRNTGIPADVWRFYIYYNRPETSDYRFSWKDFQEKVNGELIGNFANLVNRTLIFLSRFYNGKVPNVPIHNELWAKIRERQGRITEELNRAELRLALHNIFALSDIGNKAFQECEPWRLVREGASKATHRGLGMAVPKEDASKEDASKEDALKAATLIRTLTSLVHDLAILIKPYLPETAMRILSYYGREDDSWSQLGNASLPERLSRPEILFQKIEDKEVADLRARFSGTAGGQTGTAEEQTNSAAAGVQNAAAGVQNASAGVQNAAAGVQSAAAGVQNASAGVQNAAAGVQNASAGVQSSAEERFKAFKLCAARITAAEQHPNAEKLYVLTLDDGSGTPRQICSGLVEHCRKEELTDKTIILLANLKPARFRGVESQGMLLAVENESKELEILQTDAAPGQQVALNNEFPLSDTPAAVSIKRFAKIRIYVRNYQVMTGESPLTIAQKPICTTKIAEGIVG